MAYFLFDNIGGQIRGWELYWRSPAGDCLYFVRVFMLSVFIQYIGKCIIDFFQILKYQLQFFQCSNSVVLRYLCPRVFQCCNLAWWFKLSPVHVRCCWGQTAHCKAGVKKASGIWSGKRQLPGSVFILNVIVALKQNGVLHFYLLLTFFLLASGNYRNKALLL